MRVLEEAFPCQILTAKFNCPSDSSRSEGNTYRALIWETARGRQVLDRIYPTDESTACLLIKKWAFDRNYLVHAGRGTVIDKNNLSHDHYRVKSMPCKPGDFSFLPYLDTFMFWEHDGDRFVAYQTNGPNRKEMSGYHGVNVFLPKSKQRKAWYEGEDEDEWDEDFIEEDDD